MTTYLILFRGINVGGKNLLPMKELKLLLASEFGDIETYIQTGNLVLKSPEEPLKIAAIIEEKVNSKFGFKPKVMALNEGFLRDAISANPYQEAEGKMVHFYFCENTPSFDFDSAAQLAANAEQYELIGNVFYLFAPNGIGRSKLAAKVEKLLAVPATARNLNTVQKLQTMIDTFNQK